MRAPGDQPIVPVVSPLVTIKGRINVPQDDSVSLGELDRSRHSADMSRTQGSPKDAQETTGWRSRNPRAKPAERPSVYPATGVDKENISLITSPASNITRAATPPLSSSTSTVSSPAGLCIPQGAAPLQNFLTMDSCAKRIDFDLRTLDDDPRSIIELLKATQSDRDKWMIVGAFYKRKGNVYAALTVVSTMVKVLEEFGFKSNDMTPAFLMLSSCHTELWKQSRTPDGSETETSLAHLDKSRRWLQLVYGSLYSDSLEDDDWATRSALEMVDHPSCPLHVASPKSPRAAIKRDIQDLRDLQATNFEELDNVRAAKRRLEDEAASERATRRRLERTLHDLEARLAKAQRRADAAGSLARLEVSARRRCEDAIAEERAKRWALEDQLKAQSQSAKPLLEGLANLFQKSTTQAKTSAPVGLGLKGLHAETYNDRS
ncbi:hypothetical protein BC834DRAFT_117468 [Gloeopeniophorella convolvens]|nr:hypothetical protein BC834DRAFT_117468 [Gloeopeniophorella convolvens]